MQMPPRFPREKEMQPMQVNNSMVKPATNPASGAAFVPFGKRPLEFVTCFKVMYCHFILWSMHKWCGINYHTFWLLTPLNPVNPEDTLKK